jgi:hypothetical protein
MESLKRLYNFRRGCFGGWFRYATGLQKFILIDKTSALSLIFIEVLFYFITSKIYNYEKDLIKSRIILDYLQSQLQRNLRVPLFLFNNVAKINLACSGFVPILQEITRTWS